MLSLTTTALFSLLPLFPLFPSLVSSRAVQPLQQRAACPSVHLFLIRGNDEPYPGRLGDLATAVCARFGSGACDYEDVKYDNPEDFYCVAVNDGPKNALSQMTAFNGQCPDAHIVLAGYSQGGQVVGDVLGGGGGKFYDGCVQQDNAGLDASAAPGNKIAAAIILGDMRHTAGQSYNTGDGSGKSSAYPRPDNQLAGMNNWASQLVSYCDAVDPICARGNDGKDHEQYINNYKEAAATFVQDKISALDKKTTASDPNGDPDVQQAAVESAPVTSTLLAALAAESPAPSSADDEKPAASSTTASDSVRVTVSSAGIETPVPTDSAQQSSILPAATTLSTSPSSSAGSATSAAVTSGPVASTASGGASPTASGQSAASSLARLDCTMLFTTFLAMLVMGAFAL